MVDFHDHDRSRHCNGQTGQYEPRQCDGSTGYCWCVDVTTGMERSGTRRPPGEGPVDCAGAQPFLLFSATAPQSTPILPATPVDLGDVSYAVGDNEDVFVRVAPDEEDASQVREYVVVVPDADGWERTSILPAEALEEPWIRLPEAADTPGPITIAAVDREGRPIAPIPVPLGTHEISWSLESHWLGLEGHGKPPGAAKISSVEPVDVEGVPGFRIVWEPLDSSADASDWVPFG